jgi:hypothetical protein
MEKKRGRPAKVKAEPNLDMEQNVSRTKGKSKVRDSNTIMSEPLVQIGQIVDVVFLGQKRICTVLSVEKHPINENKWILSAKENTSTRVFSFIGINGSEEHANIYYNEEID